MLFVELPLVWRVLSKSLLRRVRTFLRLSLLLLGFLFAVAGSVLVVVALLCRRGFELLSEEAGAQRDGKSARPPGV